MKAIIEGIVVEGVTITGRHEGLGLFVEWKCPASNVNAQQLLHVKQAGFSFRIKDDVCHFCSRICATKFEPDEEPENRYQALVMVDGHWFDALGESLTAGEMSIALRDLLGKYENIKIQLV